MWTRFRRKSKDPKKALIRILLRAFNTKGVRAPDWFESIKPTSRRSGEKGDVVLWTTLLGESTPFFITLVSSQADEELFLRASRRKVTDVPLFIHPADVPEDVRKKLVPRIFHLGEEFQSMRDRAHALPGPDKLGS